MRKAIIKRITGETKVEMELSIDGTGKYNISTGCGFLNHMLELFTRHSRFDITLTCQGDTHVDDHHTVEDVAIVLGKGMKEALGEKRGILRYGNKILPMDEALVMVALDISGRPYLGFEANVKDKVGTFDTELVEEFFMALTRELGLTLHIRQLAGKNTHHIIEAMFKGVAHSFKEAVKVEYGEEIPSTKGIL